MHFPLLFCFFFGCAIHLVRTDSMNGSDKTSRGTCRLFLLTLYARSATYVVYSANKDNVFLIDLSGILNKCIIKINYGFMWRKRVISMQMTIKCFVSNNTKIHSYLATTLILGPHRSNAAKESGGLCASCVCDGNQTLFRQCNRENVFCVVIEIPYDSIWVARLPIE